MASNQKKHNLSKPRKEEIAKPDEIIVRGVVEERLPSAMFRVKIENGNVIMAHTCGKIKKYHITIVVGDAVIVKLSVYDLTKGRIVQRVKENVDNS